PSHAGEAANQRGLTSVAGSDRREQALRSLAEYFVRREEAEDHVAIGRKIVKVARMHRDAVCRQEVDRQILARTCRGNSQHGAPTAFHLQAGDGPLRGQLPVKLPKIPAHAFDDLLLESMPQFEKFRYCQL